MILALDTETTGLDLYHGALPFFVTLAYPDTAPEFYEWPVDPWTRVPCVPEEDISEIARKIKDADRLVLQNAKFDYAALRALDPRLIEHWDWDKVQDTLIAGHLLASNQPHNLTDMGIQYLGIDIEPFELEAKEACMAARRLVKSKHLNWRIAKAGLPEMPSAKETTWKFDMWLPRAMCLWCQEMVRTGEAEEIAPRKKICARSKKPPQPTWIEELADPEHQWLYVLQRYANTDSEVTLALWQTMSAQLHKRHLWKIYQQRMKVVPVTAAMEARGVTINSQRLQGAQDEYRVLSQQMAERCTNLAATDDFELAMPSGGTSKALTEYVFDHLKLPPVKASKKTGAPSLDKYVIEHYVATLPANSKALTFVKALGEKRKRDTAISSMDGYRRFWKQLLINHYDPEHVNEKTIVPDWYILHPSLNPTGTDTLRCSMERPNAQSVSKNEHFNLRTSFGPSPGREWWSMDAKNLELRIPAYEAGEEEMIALFENPDDPPYYGSNHLLNFHTVYPDLWEAALKEVGFDKVGPYVKKKYASTWYQWCKNGNFAVQYGSIDRTDGTGTADRAYHQPGCQAKLKNRFKAIHGPGGLNERCIKYAEKYGYVETLPDRTVDPNRGYPILCTRTEQGRILPTVPLNYRVQSTACWWMQQAEIRVYNYLEMLNSQPAAFGNLRTKVGVSAGDNSGRSGQKKTLSTKGILVPERPPLPGGYYMILQVHDELVFDFPKGVGDEPWLTNLPVIRHIQSLMEQGGEDLIPRVPTSVSTEYHAVSWAEGKTL